jgi:ribose 5-phosphate isomerase B
MVIYIGADHGGFHLKEQLKQALGSDENKFIDLGALTEQADDDYPDFSAVVAEKVSEAGGDARGIVICRSGFGVDIVANKFKGIRSALAMSPEHIRAGRHDDDVNVLALAADFIPAEKAFEIARVFLSTPFGSDERFSRRVKKIIEIESKK